MTTFDAIFDWQLRIGDIQLTYQNKTYFLVVGNRFDNQTYIRFFNSDGVLLSSSSLDYIITYKNDITFFVDGTVDRHPKLADLIIEHAKQLEQYKTFA